MNLRTTLIPPSAWRPPMLLPHVTEVRHHGASPHAPMWTPAQTAAASRCEPLRKPPPILPVAVDVYPIDMEDDSL